MLDERDPQHVWRRRSELVWRRIGDEAVVLDFQAKVLRGVNETGWTIWELLDGNLSLEEIASHVARDFSISEEVARRDVRTFMEELEAAGLVEKV